MRSLSTALRLATFACVVLTYAGQISADEPVVTFGATDADTLVLLTGSFYVNDTQVVSQPFWWNHTDLTASVQSTVNDDPIMVQAIHDGIALWSTVLATRLPGISLTDITAEAPNPKSADIIIHYVAHNGGIVKGGFANCGPQKCLTIVVKSDQPDGYVKKDETTVEEFDPLRVQRTVIHEIGHALGLGHAAPLEQSLDLMGYGWAYAVPDVPPILSDCDLQGIATAFSWFFNGTPPAPVTISRLVC